MSVFESEFYQRLLLFAITSMAVHCWFLLSYEPLNKKGNKPSSEQGQYPQKSTVWLLSNLGVELV